jgi:hypothetical protein
MVQIISSRHVQPRHLKMLFWGDTATRKTESILRFFPDVLLIDTEGNAEQCTSMPEIPEFLLAKTKDIDDVIQIVDDVAAGKYAFADGRPVQTLAIDSISVLWAMRKDTRALVAEQRNQRWGKSPEDATLTQLDWSMAKRPLMRLNARLANCPIRFVVYTARLQDKYQEDAKNKDRIVKTGEAPAAVKGLEYDMNLVLRMRHANDGGWECQVMKAQGALGHALPVGKVLRAFPVEAIMEYTGSHPAGPAEIRSDEESVHPEATRSSSNSEGVPRPMTPPVVATPSGLEAFYAQAARLGYRTPDGGVDRQRILAVLQAKGHRGFSPARSAHLLMVLREALNGDAPSSPGQAVLNQDAL